MIQHTPKLWFSPDDLVTLRRRIAEGDPTASGIFRNAKAIADRPVTPAETDGEGQYPEACAIAHLITGESVYASRAFDYLMQLTSEWTTAQLSLAAWALVGAIVHECCYAAWTPKQQVAATTRLVKLFNGQREVDSHVGNPHDVNNNHWAVSHAGAAMAAMAAHGHPLTEGGEPCDMSEGIAWARGRVKAFLMHHGDKGLYHEGLGYMAYPASFWLPAVVALKRFDGYDLVEQFPNIRQMGASLYAAGCARSTVSDDTEPSKSYGMKLSWNDDGPGWMQCNVNTILMHLARPEHVGALRWMYDRLSGVHAPDQSFSPGWQGWFFTLFYYPYDTAPVDPAGILPLHYTDSRQGLSIFRNRYKDGDDAILGCYARTTFVGGHAQDDAGSLRLMALGHDWMMGGGQARGEAEYQSVVMPADGRRKPTANGAVMWDEPGPAGGVFAMDLRRPSFGYAERYVSVDFSGACGSPVLLALLDQIDDHLGRDWRWNMSYERGLALTVHDDGRGFALIAPDGANLVARFLGAKPAMIEPKQMPDSARTFQAGFKRNYPGRPYIQASFTKQEHLGIYVVMAIQRGPAPKVELIEGLDLRVNAWSWKRPFGPAIPAAFRLGQSGGLCKFPAGVKGFKA